MRAAASLQRRRKTMPWLLGLLIVLGVASAAAYPAYRRDLRRARANVLSRSRILETRCGPIEYATLGEGPPVLVLHGTSGGWDQGIFAARGLLAHGFQLIAPSRFGYLRTPLPAKPSPEAEADTWADFLDALQIQRVSVIAFSAGAAPAVQVALRHPDRVSALVLIVPGAGGWFPNQRLALRVRCWICSTDSTFRCGRSCDWCRRSCTVSWRCHRW
jgi:2-hydroxy-6-oxonona-2,4-dienedioate hydrolase